MKPDTTLPVLRNNISPTQLGESPAPPRMDSPAPEKPAAHNTLNHLQRSVLSIDIGGLLGSGSDCDDGDDSWKRPANWERE
jgi:hypothetical protein